MVPDRLSAPDGANCRRAGLPFVYKHEFECFFKDNLRIQQISLQLNLGIVEVEFLMGAGEETLFPGIV